MYFNKKSSNTRFDPSQRENNVKVQIEIYVDNDLTFPLRNINDYVVYRNKQLPISTMKCMTNKT